MNTDTSEIMPGMEAPGHVDESMDIVQGAIEENPVTVEMARSLGRMYTLYTTKQLDLLLEANPDLKPVRGFNNLLKEAMAKADEGADYTDIGRFLKSESEKLGYNRNVKNDPQVQVGQQLRKMADALENPNADQPAPFELDA